MVTAAPSSLYDALKLTDTPESERQFVGFTVNAMQVAGGGAIRAEMAALGYDTQRIRVSDPGLTEQYRQHATDLSQSITETFNAMLQRQIDGLPDGLSVDEARAKLADFYASVHEYNTSVLVPFTTQTARQQATRAFYRENGLAPQWSVEPPETDQDDVCAEAIDASPMDDATAQGYEFPAHQRCPHSLVADASSIDEADLPPADALWDGTGSSQASEPFIFYSDDQPRDEHGRWVGSGGTTTADAVGSVATALSDRVGSRVPLLGELPEEAPTPRVIGSTQGGQQMLTDMTHAAQATGHPVDIVSQQEMLDKYGKSGVFGFRREDGSLVIASESPDHQPLTPDHQALTMAHELTHGDQQDNPPGFQGTPAQQYMQSEVHAAMTAHVIADHYQGDRGGLNTEPATTIHAAKYQNSALFNPEQTNYAQTVLPATTASAVRILAAAGRIR